MSKQSTPMTHEDADRIQSHADKTGTNQDFAQRAQAAAGKNENEETTEDQEKSGVKSPK